MPEVMLKKNGDFTLINYKKNMYPLFITMLTSLFAVKAFKLLD